MTSRASPAASWLGLGSASRLLGVSPASLRRWSDSGRVKVYTTPGGHRRFRRAALEAMLPTDRVRRPSMERLGETADRVSRLLGAEARRPAPDDAWSRGIDERDREAFRERGRALAGSLLAYLDGSSKREDRERLDECAVAAREYGRMAALAGLSLSDSVQGFVRFRGPFIAELAGLSRRQRLDTIEATELLQKAEACLDRLLLATMEGHAGARAGWRAAPRAAARSPHTSRVAG